MRRGDALDRPAGPAGSYHAHFALVPDRSAVLVEARSSVGPLTFGVIGLTGSIETRVRGGGVLPDELTTATVIVPTEGLRSGNAIYDAELRRRIDARRFPEVVLELDECVPSGAPDHYQVASEVTIHGVARRLEGTVVVDQPSPGRLSVTGEQVVDIRDFDISSPTVLMLRIYPGRGGQAVPRSGGGRAVIWLVALASGYVLGARADKEDFDDVVQALRAVLDSEEVHDLVVTVRGHVGHALRNLADIVEQHQEAATSVRATATSVVGADLVDRVRRLVGEPVSPQ